MIWYALRRVLITENPNLNFLTLMVYLVQPCGTTRVSTTIGHCDRRPLGTGSRLALSTGDLPDQARAPAPVPTHRTLFGLANRHRLVGPFTGMVTTGSRPLYSMTSKVGSSDPCYADFLTGTPSCWTAGVSLSSVESDTLLSQATSHRAPGTPDLDWDHWRGVYYRHTDGYSLWASPDRL